MSSPRVLKVTPAAVSTYLTCPRRWLVQYVDKAPQRGGPWAHLSLGNSVHRALAGLWDVPAGGRTAELAASLLARHWDSSGYRDEEQEAAIIGRAVLWLVAYVPDQPWGSLRAVERTVSCLYAVPSDGAPGVTLEGRVDRLDDRAGRLVVVDYKNGRTAPGEDEAAGSFALAVYCLAAGRMLRQRCAVAELHHVPTGTVAVVEYDRDRIMRQVERGVEVAREAAGNAATLADTIRGDSDPAEVRDALFPPATGALCASCPFRYRCPEGTAAREQAEPWAYLPDLGES